MSVFDPIQGPPGPPQFTISAPTAVYTGINTFFAILTLLLLTVSPALTVIAYRAAF